MKNFFKVLFVMLCAFLMTACGSENVDNQESGGSGTSSGFNVNKDLYFIMDGVKYELNNLTYDKFKENGWYFKDSSIGSKVLQGKATNRYTSPVKAQLVNDNYDKKVSLYVYFYNNGDNDKKLEDTNIYGVAYNGSVNSGQISLIENQPVIELPGGLKLGDSKDKIISKLGEPVSSSSYSLIYGTGFTADGSYKFDFYDSVGVTGVSFSKDIDI